MSTSDPNAAGTLPKAPELHGVDAGQLASVADPGAAGANWPSTSQISAWANEFFKAAGGGGAPSGIEPGLPTLPGTVSGAALPDPSTLGRRSATELPSSPPTLPFVTSVAPPATMVADPHLGQLDYSPQVLQSTIVGSPTLGAIDPTRGFTPQPQASGREGLAWLAPGAAPSVPYYFMNQPSAQRPDASPLDLSKINALVPEEWTDPKLTAAPQTQAAPNAAPVPGYAPAAAHAPAPVLGYAPAGSSSTVPSAQLHDPAGEWTDPKLTAAPYTQQAAPVAAPGYSPASGGVPSGYVPASTSSAQSSWLQDPALGYNLRNAQSTGTSAPLARDARKDVPASARPNAAPTHVRAVPEHLSQQNNDSVREQPRPRPFEVESIRADFPILDERVNGRKLVWLDNAATTQKPQAVIDRLAFFYAHENSNVHRAAHSLAARASDAYEDARETVRRFLKAGSAEEIVFVRGTTEGINLIANSWGSRFLEAGDEIIVTRIEHHSNIVPWKMVCERTGARLRVAEVDDTGQVQLEQYERLFNSHTRLVSFTHVSNALGTILPVHAMTQIAHRYGARVVIDGAQSVCHMPVDVQALDCDFYVFSGHKVFGPTGIGAVYGKRALLEAMPPWQGGGAMIADVTFESTVYNPPPARFEAGTGNIADAVGLATALEYLEALGLENVARHEHELLEYGTAKLLEVPGLKLVGTAKEKAAVLGFVLENVPAEQVGAALASNGIAVRSGHHCAQPALRRFGYEATVRPSLALYNNRADLDALVATLHDLQSRWLR